MRRLYPPPKEVLLLHRWRRRLKRGDRVWIYGGYEKAWPAKFDHFRKGSWAEKPEVLWVPSRRKVDGLAFANIWFKMPWGRYSKWRQAWGDAHFPICNDRAFFPLDPTHGKGLRFFRAEVEWERRLRKCYWNSHRPDPLHQHWTPKWLPEHLQK